MQSGLKVGPDGLTIEGFSAPGAVFYSDRSSCAVFYSDTKVIGAVFYSDTKAPGAVFYLDTIVRGAVFYSDTKARGAVFYLNTKVYGAVFILTILVSRMPDTLSHSVSLDPYKKKLKSIISI